MNEREAIVAWLWREAGRVRSDLSRLHSRKQLTPTQTSEWEGLISTMTGIARAIERGEHMEGPER